MRKKIKGYDNYYVSADGKIFSDYKGDFKEKSLFLCYNGYKRVTLWKNGKQKKYFVHRLVAEYFVKNENPELFKSVDHIDRNILNNNKDNLRWITFSANSGMANAKLKKEEVDYIKKHYKRGNGTELAKKFNCDVSMVVKISKGKAYQWMEVIPNAN